MIKFSEVLFEDFSELVFFLKFNDEEIEFLNITKRLSRFIENMTAMQSITIGNIVKDILSKDIENAKSQYINFHKIFPSVNFDTEGKLDISEIDYSEISLQSIELLYEQSKEKNTSVDKQIRYAKELTPLIEMKGRFEYPIKKSLYFKSNNPKPISEDQLKKAENIIKELFPNGNILGKFLHFIYDKKYENVYIFVEHFLYRLDILYKDKALSHPVNRSFYEKLKTI